jgi:hypothetical protein
MWSGDAGAFLAASPADVAARVKDAAQDDLGLTAGLALLRDALRQAPSQGWHVVIGLRLLRLGRRVDAVLVRDGAVLALRLRPDARAFLAVDRAAAEDAALDLADFHAGCRGLPVVPVLVVAGGHARRTLPLPLAGATPVVEATRLLLPGVLRGLAALCPPRGNDPARWHAAPYRPVPSLIAAACTLYARHDVPALLRAQAGQGGLSAAAGAVAAAVREAQRDGAHLVVFVTGTPGAGKTLLGLNLAFGGGAGAGGAAFLTGNPALVHVLREALARDFAARGGDRRAARQRLQGVIQALPAFRDHHAVHPGTPPERLVVLDEAQRCWDAAHAVSKTRNRPVPLQDSEPGLLLDAMGRHAGWAAVVCLVGGGQEIHDGEGGLAAWGAALASRPAWRVAAAARATVDPRQQLGAPRVTWDPRLHLAAPVRAIRAPQAAAWVDAMLAGDVPAALALAAGGVPFEVTRSLDAMRLALRGGTMQGRGTRRAGLVGSSGARRLRAEGLGAVLPHQDEDAVARWFLDDWPDTRSSDALEVLATEFCVQGLELDRAGLCWDADLVRIAGTWQARGFRGSAWTLARTAEARSNRINAYRVLLTRARHGTVIWVPRGHARDRTRDPALYDAVAEHLMACGAAALDVEAAGGDTAAIPQPVLL